MKKFIAFLVSAVLTLGAVSCQKDIDNAKSLGGSTWVSQAGTNIYTLSFKNATDFEMDVLTLPLEHHYYQGTFIITGNKTGLQNCNITLSFDSSWTEKWSSGYFKSDSELVLESLVFTRK